MRADNPLLTVKDSRKLLITPHIAWAGIETRSRLINIIWHQIGEFQNSYRSPSIQPGPV